MALGDLDYPMARDCTAVIASRIPGCSAVPVPGADHMLPLRAPGVVAELIRASAAAAAG